jgi:hypothetical protein
MILGAEKKMSHIIGIIRINDIFRARFIHFSLERYASISCKNNQATTVNSSEKNQLKSL